MNGNLYRDISNINAGTGIFGYFVDRFIFRQTKPKL